MRNKYNFNPEINNNKGYIMKNEQPNNYKRYNNNYRIEFKYEKSKRPNNKVAYEKVNYNDYCKKNNIDKNYQNNMENGYNYYKNAIKEFENRNGGQNQNNYKNYKYNKNINNNLKINNKNISEKNIKVRKGGRVNELRRKFGFN